MLKMVRRTWERFDVQMSPRVVFSGLPSARLQSGVMHTQYATDVLTRRWQNRQLAVLRTNLTVSKQEFLLAAILSTLGPLREPLFTVTPEADSGAVRALISTLAGMENFARWNAHFPRRRTLSSFVNSTFRRLCLFCFVNSGRRVIDTEWHAFCDCPLHSASRGRFVMASGLELSSSLPSTVQDLVPLITCVRSNACKAGLLAKFALDIRSTRRHLFRQLSSDGPSGRRKVAARVLWERWRARMHQPEQYVSLSFVGADLQSSGV